MYRRLVKTFLFVLLFIPGVLYAQTSGFRDVISPGLQLYYGGFFRFTRFMPVLNLSNAYGASLKIKRITRGNQEWHHHFRFPEIDYELSYYNYNVRQYGQAFTATISFNIPLAVKNNHAWRLSTGTGLVYSTKKFDEETNPKFAAISTDLSFSLQGNVTYELKLNDNLKWNAGIAMRHFSNGKIRRPNFGMNFPLITTGITYYPESLTYADRKPLSHYKTDRKVHFHLMFSHGRKRPRKTLDKLFIVNGISFYMSRHISPISSLTAGFDGFYDTSQFHEYLAIFHKPPPPYFNKNTFDRKQAAVTGGYILHIGHTSIHAQLGYFIYLPYKIHQQFYQRYGIMYHFTPNIFSNISLKAYSGSADLIEFGLGFTL